MNVCNACGPPVEQARAIIFFVDGREISFEKDNVPFSEEIIIQRGYDLIEKLSDEKEFLENIPVDEKTTNNIKDEIKTNSRFFIEDINFDGGFSVKGMFKDESEIDNASQIIIPTIRKNIESIRNVLVHARESRENSEIKPTQKNIELLKPYLYLLRRIAETVIIKYE